MNNDREQGGTLQLLIGGGRGEPEMLLLLEAPNADGAVHVRSWTSDAWSAPPASSTRAATELLADIERWSRQGRTLNHSLAAVRHWLSG